MHIKKKDKIFIAGHKGMVGSAIMKKFLQLGYKNIVVVEKKKLNFIEQKKVFNFLKKIKPDLVIMAAAKVGGINANFKNKSLFLYENLQIQNNIIHGSYLAGVKDLIFLGSSCIYPKFSKQPIKEKYLLTGSLEKTNDAYAIAKIAGLVMCENYSKNYSLNYKSFMPSNMYGPNDNYNKENSHFFPALIRKIYEAKIYNKKKITLWGNGKPLRELLYVEDFAEAVVYFSKKKIKEPFLNIGSGKDYSIEWYAKLIMKIIGVNLKIQYDKSKPNGVMRKLLDITAAKKYGWQSKVSLENGIKKTIYEFKKGFRE